MKHKGRRGYTLSQAVYGPTDGVHFKHLFVFLENREIEATNNGSERGLRPCAIYRKITNGFRAAWAADHYSDVRSVIETARRRGVHALQAIRLTLADIPLPLTA